MLNFHKFHNYLYIRSRKVGFLIKFYTYLYDYNYLCNIRNGHMNNIYKDNLFHIVRKILHYPKLCNFCILNHIFYIRFISYLLCNNLQDNYLHIYLLAKPLNLKLSYNNYR